MSTIAFVLVALVALLHLYFMVLEMFLWTRPAGLKAFKLQPEFAQASKTLAANEGLYNGFLVAGLVWALWSGLAAGQAGRALATFFLGCVIVAGVYGAATVGRKILFVQAVPAALALAAVWMG